MDNATKPYYVEPMSREDKLESALRNAWTWVMDARDPAARLCEANIQEALSIGRESAAPIEPRASSACPICGNNWPVMSAEFADTGMSLKRCIDSVLMTQSGEHCWVDRVFLQAVADQAEPVMPVAPSGWRLVPIEPTEEMLRAANRARYGWANGGGAGSSHALVYYDDSLAKHQTMDGRLREDWQAHRAMLAAAPVAPSGAREQS